MWPGSSVSGLYFAHPEARYFTLGKIERDQVADYHTRKGLTIAEVERWLGRTSTTILLLVFGCAATTSGWRLRASIRVRRWPAATASERARAYSHTQAHSNTHSASPGNRHCLSRTHSDVSWAQ